jgi:hypothetical protein
MQAAAVVVTEPDAEEQHAWVPGEWATLCGVEVRQTQRVYAKFPPIRGSSCLTCVGLEWFRFKRFRGH